MERTRTIPAATRGPNQTMKNKGVHIPKPCFLLGKSWFWMTPVVPLQGSRGSRGSSRSGTYSGTYPNVYIQQILPVPCPSSLPPVPCPHRDPSCDAKDLLLQLLLRVQQAQDLIGPQLQHPGGRVVRTRWARVEVAVDPTHSTSNESKKKKKNKWEGPGGF